jgi:coenzyme F420-reducing hydrogenase beta subunit
LQNDKKVLFIGTPCQVAGLKKFLNKEYENLYTIDLICHGVPPHRYLQEEIKNVTNEEIDNISFRNKEGFIFELYKNGNKIYKENGATSKYYIGFLEGVFYRENCYNCIYANSKRVSDITIGDFWGLDKSSKLYDRDNSGVSVLLPITDKGLELIEICKDKMNLEDRAVEEAVQGNSQLRNPSKKPKSYDTFRRYYLKTGYIRACNIAMRRKILRGKLKNNKLLYKIYKIIKGR